MGWSSQFFTLIVIEGPNAAILLYSPTAGPGNLIGSWAAVGYTDQYGNVVPQGINVNQGILNSVSIVGGAITASTIANTIISASTIIAPTLSSGTIYETQITFDTGGGQVVGYTTTTTTVTQSSNGTYNFTVPAGVNSGKVETWGAGAGGGGGNATQGGETGGGGEYAQEPTYPMTPGNVLTYTIGNGGNGGVTGVAGTSGGDTSFDNAGVFANGGDAGNAGTGGLGGTGSTNTVHFNGGNGANSSAFTGGASGGNSGNSTANGNNGASSTSSSGAPQPAAQTGSGRGGAGGANTANGNGGGAPGAAGGGAGSGTAGGNFSKSYQCKQSRSYYGADASNGNPNGTRNSNGTIWQGGETATGGTANGTQKNAFIFPSVTADLVGVTITEVDLAVTNEHSWFGSGITVQLKEWLASQGTSLPGSWNGLGSPSLTQYTQDEGSRKTVALFSNAGNLFADLKSGAGIGFAMGPGPSAYDLSYYGYFNGAINSNSGPVMTIKGTTGSGFNTAGSGADGQVKITYASSQSIVFALAPQAGGDGTNTWAAGYTGPTTPFNPSSGTAPETWHTMGTAGSSLATGFTNQSGMPLQFMLDSNGFVHIDGVLDCSSGTAEGSPTTLFTLPAAWRPNKSVFFHWDYFPYTAANEASSHYITLNTSGVATAGFAAATTITAIVISAVFPLNANTS